MELENPFPRPCSCRTNLESPILNLPKASRGTESQLSRAVTHLIMYLNSCFPPCLASHSPVGAFWNPNTAYTPEFQSLGLLLGTQPKILVVFTAR